MKILKAKTKRRLLKLEPQHWFAIAESSFVMGSIVLLFGLTFLFLGSVTKSDAVGMFLLAGTLLAVAFATYVVGRHMETVRGAPRNAEPR